MVMGYCCPYCKSTKLKSFAFRNQGGFLCLNCQKAYTIQQNNYLGAIAIVVGFFHILCLMRPDLITHSNTLVKLARWGTAFLGIGSFVYMVVTGKAIEVPREALEKDKISWKRLLIFLGIVVLIWKFWVP